uniref:Uncharacterized protein n=1 Tax=Glossina brevipalpis TaxID=37001 RepID=A0A1A9WR02_9MUSC
MYYIKQIKKAFKKKLCNIECFWNEKDKVLGDNNLRVFGIMPVADINIGAILTLSSFHCRFIGLINGAYLFAFPEYSSYGISTELNGLLFQQYHVCLYMLYFRITANKGSFGQQVLFYYMAAVSVSVSVRDFYLANHFPGFRYIVYTKGYATMNAISYRHSNYESILDLTSELRES